MRGFIIGCVTAIIIVSCGLYVESRKPYCRDGFTPVIGFGAGWYCTPGYKPGVPN